jgi:hypothetical protein
MNMIFSIFKKVVGLNSNFFLTQPALFLYKILLDKEINMTDLAAMLIKYPKEVIISDFSSIRSLMYLSANPIIIPLGNLKADNNSDS